MFLFVLFVLMVLAGLLGIGNWIADPKGRDSKFHLVVGLLGFVFGIILLFFWLAIIFDQPFK